MTIVPPEVTKDNIQFLLEVTARLNNFFKLRRTNIAVLTHFWPPTYHNPWLKHLSLDFNCGDPRKYTRWTKAQQESRILQGRCKRGKTLIPSQMGYTSTKKNAVALFQWETLLDFILYKYTRVTCWRLMTWNPILSHVGGCPLHSWCPRFNKSHPYSVSWQLSGCMDLVGM